MRLSGAEAVFQPEGGQGEGIAMKDVKRLAQNLRIYGYLLSTSFRQRMDCLFGL